MCRAEPSRDRGLDQRRFNAFVSDETSGVYQARTDVVGFQPRVTLQHDLRRVAGGQHAEDMLDGKPAIPDDRLATEDGGVRCDSTEEARSLQVLATAHLSIRLPQFEVFGQIGRFDKPSCSGRNRIAIPPRRSVRLGVRGQMFRPDHRDGHGLPYSNE